MQTIIVWIENWNKIFQCSIFIHVSLVENRRRPTQTSFEWSSKSVLRSGMTHTHWHAHAQIWTIQTFFNFSMRQTLLTNTHTYADTHAQTLSYALTHMHSVLAYAYTQPATSKNECKHTYTHTHTPPIAYMHSTRYMLPFFICTCGRSITKILELNEFARKSQTVSAAHSNEIAHWTRQHI